MQTFCCSRSILLSIILFIIFISYFGSSFKLEKPLTDLEIAMEDDGLTGRQRQGRWGIFFTYEPICSLACRKNGKYSGRMYGGVCRCYCPRIETDPCTGSYPSCDRLCRQNGYHLGGDCIDDTNCWCFCTVRQRQSPNSTQTTTTQAPCATQSTSSVAPPSSGVALSPVL